MEPTTNQDAMAAPEPSAPTNKKENSGLKIATIICAVLAVAGLGFGVYEYLQNGQKAIKISELTAKLDLIKKETNTELVEREENGTIRTYVKPTETSSSFAVFSKNLAGTQRSVHFEPSRVFYNCDVAEQSGSDFCGYFVFGSISIDEENNLKISLGQTKQILALQTEASNVLSAAYVEHSTYDTGNQTFHGTVSQYIYYTDLSGDVYRIKLTEDEPLPIEHLEEYKEIAFIENTSLGALLTDINGHTFTVTE
jgi:hypothetical protein